MRKRPEKLDLIKIVNDVDIDPVYKLEDVTQQVNQMCEKG